MKLLIVDTYYSRALDRSYAETPGLQSQPYATQWRLLMDQCFGTTSIRRVCGLLARRAEVVANCGPAAAQMSAAKCID